MPQDDQMVRTADVVPLGGLMPRGMPRPLQDGMPVPYTSEATRESDGEIVYSVAALNVPRSRECGIEKCHLCGDELSERSATIAVYGELDNDKPLQKTPANRETLEGAFFHERCAKMAMRHCPHLRDDPAMRQPEIWVGPTAKIGIPGRVPKGWRRLKTGTARRLQRAVAAVGA
jgi:hypothetical protein